MFIIPPTFFDKAIWVLHMYTNSTSHQRQIIFQLSSLKQVFRLPFPKTTQLHPNHPPRSYTNTTSPPQSNPSKTLDAARSNSHTIPQLTLNINPTPTHKPPNHINTFIPPPVPFDLNIPPQMCTSSAWTIKTYIASGAAVVYKQKDTQQQHQSSGFRLIELKHPTRWLCKRHRDNIYQMSIISMCYLYVVYT